jgi:hypothetical protein
VLSYATTKYKGVKMTYVEELVYLTPTELKEWEGEKVEEHWHTTNHYEGDTCIIEAVQILVPGWTKDAVWVLDGELVPTDVYHAAARYTNELQELELQLLAS